MRSELAKRWGRRAGARNYPSEPTRTRGPYVWPDAPLEDAPALEDLPTSEPETVEVEAAPNLVPMPPAWMAQRDEQRAAAQAAAERYRAVRYSMETWEQMARESARERDRRESYYPGLGWVTWAV